MIISDGLSEIEYSGGTRVAIGKFDGIHLGHKKLIEEITSKNDDLKSLVFSFTFDSISFSECKEKVISLYEKRKIFEDMGVDYLIEYDLNEVTAKMEPEEFLRVILKDRLHCREIVCGPDLSFGYMGRGNVALIESLWDELSIKVTVIDKVKYQGEDISSTRIREAIRTGHMIDAEKMLRG